MSACLQTFVDSGIRNHNSFIDSVGLSVSPSAGLDSVFACWNEGRTYWYLLYVVVEEDEGVTKDRRTSHGPVNCVGQAKREKSRFLLQLYSRVLPVFQHPPVLITSSMAANYCIMIHE